MLGRALTARLEGWLAGVTRKPLILRGARQAGRTWLARDVAARTGRDLVELNFEWSPELARAFDSNDRRMTRGARAPN